MHIHNYITICLLKWSMYHGSKGRKEGGREEKDISDSNVQQTISKRPLWVDANIEKGRFKENLY